MNQPVKIPSLIRNCIGNWYYNQNKVLFAQIATMNQAKPHIRTMKLYEITPKDTLIFLTRTDTQKCSDLTQNPSISILIYDENYGQIIGEGSASIKTYNTHGNAMDHYWNLMTKESQEIYSLSPELIALFGVLEITIDKWECLILDPKNYRNSQRIAFNLEPNRNWKETNLPPI